MNKHFAERVVAMTGQCISQLIAVLGDAEASLTADEFKVFKRAVARVINTIDVEIVERAVADFPDLQPWGSTENSV